MPRTPEEAMVVVREDQFWKEMLDGELTTGMKFSEKGRIYSEATATGEISDFAVFMGQPPSYPESVRIISGSPRILSALFPDLLPSNNAQ